MATFTKGTAYKFIGNNLPENQCVTYSMFEVYVPVTAYNIMDPNMGGDMNDEMETVNDKDS